MKFSAVIVAAGSGTRAGPGAAKQWRLLAGKPVLRWSAEALLAAGAREVVVVVAEDAHDTAAEVLAGLRFTAVTGGATRSKSVQAGLQVLTGADDEPVLVHDAARPFVTAAHVEALLKALEDADGAIPALPVGDTLKQHVDGHTITASREGLWRAQTPQAFRKLRLVEAYAAWSAEADPTDDAAVVEAAAGRVAIVPGDPMLMKLTWPEDFAMAERLAGSPRVTRIGQGYDAHRFGPGDAVWLCGVKIAHDQALVGHSDADAGLHAVTDALLGAIGEGDIGDHFPPSDPQWKGASSDRFLLHAVELLNAKGGRVVNADVTLICEAPKIAPHRAAMRQRLAELLRTEAVSVKATTTEGMGFTGRREGLAAQAIVAVEMPG